MHDIRAEPSHRCGDGVAGLWMNTECPGKREVYECFLERDRGRVFTFRKTCTLWFYFFLSFLFCNFRVTHLYIRTETTVKYEDEIDDWADEWDMWDDDDDDNSGDEDDE